jgi:two-component system, NarL family, response regulator DevR
MGARLLIAQPYELLLEALEHLLGAEGLHVVARCTRTSDLGRCVAAYEPDVVLVDVEMAAEGDVDGLVGVVRSGLNGGRIVLLVPGVDPVLARDSLRLEVDGVVLKCASSCDVVASLRRVLAGDAVFPASWLAAAHRADCPKSCLSVRQIEVLELIAEGLPNETIAERLFISRNTVKFHVAAIYQRLGVSNRVQAAQALSHLRTAG